MYYHKTCIIFLALFLVVFSSTADARQSPAQERIIFAQKAIQKKTNYFEAYNSLAMALSRRARETGNPNFYDQAEKAIKHSLKLSHDNYNTQKIQVWILLEKHEFTKALKFAQALNKHMPDVIMVYGMLTDAHVELGNYEEAEASTQWMLDLRPGNVHGLTRAAYLRELFGDINGAIDLMMQAFYQTSRYETEERAWLLTQIAHLHLMTGKAETASKLLMQALELFPDYHYALAALAEAYTAQQKYEEVANLFCKYYEVAPHPENLYLFAKALERLGLHKEAKECFKKFEQEALLEVDKADNANRYLIFYYANEANNPIGALRISWIEIVRRKDVYTLDAYAWALYVNGHYDQARKQIEKALAVGIRDAKIFYHAGVIAAKQGSTQAAKEYFNKTIELNPSSQWADAVRKFTIEDL